MFPMLALAPIAVTREHLTINAPKFNPERVPGMRPEAPNHSQNSQP